MNRHIFLSIGFLVVVGLACSLQQAPPPVYVTTTPIGSDATLTPIIITATPEIPPTSAPIPTPTLPPVQGLQNAQVDMRNGNYENAVITLQAVVNDQFLDESVRAQAAFNLGQAAVREGLFQAAVDTLTSFIESYPDDDRLGKAYFLRGDAYLGLSDWQSAIGDFQQYLALKPGVLDSYAHERIGDAYLNLGQTDLALGSYLAASGSARSLTAQVAMREKLAAAYINNGELGNAVGQYDAILGEARNGAYRASIEYQAAQLELQLGLTEQGYNRMTAMIELYPATVSAYYALQDLLAAGIPVDDKLRADISYANEDYNDALAALNRYTTQVPLVPVEVLLTLGRTYRNLGNYPAAYTTFQTILDQYTTDPSFGLAFLEQGRTLFLEGDITSSIARYTELAASNPQAPEAPEALWRAGYLHGQQGNVEAALATFDALLTNYPGTKQALEGGLLAATLAYNAGQVERAQGFYTTLANTGSGTAQAQAFLWLGRLYQERGQTDLAQQSFTGAAQANPGGYYSVRADDILNGRVPFQPPSDYQWEFDEQTDIADAEQWLRDTFGIEQTGALYPLSDALAQDPRMIRGQELWELADFEAAQIEFNNLVTAYENDPLAQYQLAVYFKDIALYRTSIEIAARLIITSGADNFTAPRYLVRLRYPIHYLDLVLPAAAQWGVDPLLVFSLIRQESLFEGFATSFAAAQGLMQIIPPTGEEINQRINWSADYQNSDLYRPYVNVYFGVFYLDWVMENFADGQPYVALAGYNGGPGNAAEWFSISGPDLDLFVQTVTFAESKLYVERIYEQYTIYRYIYGIE